MNKSSILIIDDNPEILESLSLILKSEYRVFTASNGSAALSAIERNETSLVILDLQMPEMDGLELLRRIRQINENVAVLIMTGHSCHDWAKRCADLNVQGYFEKPYDIDALASRVRKLLATDDFKVLRTLWKDNYEEKLAALSHTVKKTLCYLQKNFQKEVNRDDLAALLRVCPDHLGRQFQKECGVHITEYVNMLRIDRSKECLRSSDDKINDIASSLGYPNTSYFCKLFKKYTGHTPQEFRKKHVKP